MRINIAKSAGFCFGVKRALKIAFEAAKLSGTIEMLGDIVHNEDVAKEVKAAGIKKIKQLKKGKDRTFLIRAHGVPAKTLQKALGLSYKIIDATCPMVKEIHRIVKELEQKGFTIIVIGDKSHDETIGILGQLKNKSILINKLEKFPFGKFKKIKKAAVVIQSTQNFEKINKIIKVLKKYISNLKFFNTICQPTRTKQKEIKIMSLKNDVMIIVGSKTSANTKRLYEMSKSFNKKSFWIQSKNDIRPEWFRRAKTAGIAAGASTPDYSTKEVIKYIKSRFSAD